MINSVEEIIGHFESVKKDYNKFTTKNNKAAGKRLRKYLLAFMKLGKQARKQVSERIKSIGRKKEKK